MARPDVPRATYRLQLNRGFTFARATALVPYLAELGVSHVYLSPYFKASPGSLHGYDIVDHNALNPEIGSRAELDMLCAALREHGMGQLLDIVPNHVAVLGADNPWWQDVLRNGRAAAHASFFDIDWERLRDELHGRLLVPVLGEPYGVVLERGELALAFDAAQGELSIRYGGDRFPLDPPKSYVASKSRCSSSTVARALRRASMRWTSYSRRRSFASRRGGWRPTTSTIAASSTSTSWRRCAWKSRRSSRPLIACSSSSWRAAM